MFDAYIEEDCFTITNKCIHLKILGKYCELKFIPHVRDFNFETVIETFCEYLKSGIIDHKHIDDIVYWMIYKSHVNKSLDELKRLCDQDSYLRIEHNRSLKEGLYKYDHKICLLDVINSTIVKYEL